jgi:hypothetical protein
MSEATLHGVIDSIEKNWALLALDDGQRLVWPRERLPLGVARGVAVVLRLIKSAKMGVQVGTGEWEGVVSVQTQACGQALAITLGAQSLNWPAVEGISVGDVVSVTMQMDAADTDRRLREIRRLVSDLFD